MDKMKIAVAGTGYVGLSIATLLSQKNEVVALDVIPEKVDMINNRISPIKDEYIEKYFNEKELNLKENTVTTKNANGTIYIKYIAGFVLDFAFAKYRSGNVHLIVKASPLFNLLYVNPLITFPFTL